MVESGAGGDGDEVGGAAVFPVQSVDKRRQLHLVRLVLAKRNDIKAHLKTNGISYSLSDIGSPIRMERTKGSGHAVTQKVIDVGQSAP